MFGIAEDQDDAEFFFLNPTSGLLTLARTLTSEDQLEYKVRKKVLMNTWSLSANANL